MPSTAIALRQHGRGRRAVTRDIRGLGRHFAHDLRAHVFELIRSSISFATTTPEFTMVGEPYARSSTTVRRLWPKRHADRLRERVDAGEKFGSHPREK